ncbi:cupredoxin domain-containing protein (plasmid) [Leptolyngbya sp. NK1-12]|uniref:Cupredoxin domain-containing protein n=1 Tax=Leptolyngbya sp. NK1-12 TaxID=2547451 RepID=A0AA97AKS4_9CYAN|nr:cupredoxin domain-containing protein [Leptolyngbya sp. NK1-12]
MSKKRMVGRLAGLLGLILVMGSGTAVAQMPMEMPATEGEQRTQFRRIDQPLGVKGAVAAGGLALIGLELWWFLFSKPKSQKAESRQGIQEVTVMVDGGYDPSRVVVNAGQPVRLNFDRKDPSSCLEEVRFPDFRIAQELPLNQVTPIEFTPNKPGRYEFTCGMNMFRGIVDVQAAEGGTATAIASVPQSAHPTDQVTHHTEHLTNSTSSVEATMTSAGIQEATVTVAKGYQPKRVIVEAGYPIHLHFDRKNLSECYDQLLIPEFDVAIDLKPDQITTVEFTPAQPGEYEFMCGMKMNYGMIEVRPAKTSSSKKWFSQDSIREA